MGGRTKEQRRAWWFSLSDDEQQAYIERRQEKKTAWRQKHPKKEPAYNPKYPWATEGVGPGNREQWQRTILKKNPWLSPGIFSAKPITAPETQ